MWRRLPFGVEPLNREGSRSGRHYGSSSHQVLEVLRALSGQNCTVSSVPRKIPEVNISTTEDRCHNADRMQVPSFYYGALKSAKPKITIGTVRARFVSHFL